MTVSNAGLRIRAGIAPVLAMLAALWSTAAQAGIVTFNSDADFITYQNSGAFTKTFGGNVRWGNGAGNGDWEYAVVNGADIPIGAIGQTPWAGSNSHDVSFSYDGGTSATLALGGIGTLTRAVPAAPTVLFARVRDSVTIFSTLSNIEIDLAYNGVGVDYSYNLLTGDANAEYWGVADANLALGFTLTADASLEGPRSSGSDPMYQFKVGVPEPASLGLAVLGAAGLIWRRGHRAARGQ